MISYVYKRLMPSRIWNPFSIYSFNPPQRVGQNTRGIVSLNPNLELHPLFITRDQRLIVCQITHIQAHFPPIIVCNIYAPAQSKERQVFYDAILSLHIFQTSSLRTLSDPSSIDGTSDPGSHADVLSTFLDSPIEEDSISPTEQLTTAKSTASLAQKRWHELFN